MKNIKNVILITILTRVDLIVNLFSNLLQIGEQFKTKENMNHNLDVAYWITQIIATIIIFYIVYKVFNNLDNLKSELKIQMIINEFRNKENFKESYKYQDFLKLPNESEEQFNERAKNGIYKERMVREINYVKTKASSVLKNKTMEEIEKIISQVYDLSAQKTSI